MDTDQDVAVGVHLQEVPIHGVKHKPPEDGGKEISQEVQDSFLFPLENMWDFSNENKYVCLFVCVCVSYLVGKEES